MNISVLWKLLLVASLVPLTTGCAKFDIRKNIPWGEGSDGKVDRPLRVDTVWTDTVMTKAGETPKRGFGGRLYFFGSDNAQEPVKVEGTLVVYAFNEVNRDPNNVVPDKKVVYPIKDFDKLYSKTKMGHSYSVWVPWDEVGGPQMQISLIARFIPKDTKGGVVLSEQTKLLLPGSQPLVAAGRINSFETIPKLSQDGIALPAGTQVPPYAVGQPIQGAAGNGVTGMMPNATGQNSIQQISYQTPVNNTGSNTSETGLVGEATPSNRLKTTTIPLHGNQQAHFVQQPQPTALPQVNGVWAANNPPYNPQMYGAAQGNLAPEQAGGSAWTNVSYGTRPGQGFQNGAVSGPVSQSATQGSAAQGVQHPMHAGPVSAGATAPAGSPSAHSSPPRLRALGAPIARLENARDRWQPRRVAQPSGPSFQQ